MIVTRLNNGRLIFSAENWKEMFRIRVANHLFRMNKDIRLPRGYIKTDEGIMTDTSNFWIWYLWPFIMIGLFIGNIWWTPARWLYKRGYIRVKECERKNIMSWFWPLKLRLKSNNRQ